MKTVQVHLVIYDVRSVQGWANNVPENRTITAMRMRNVTILKFHGGWAVQMDFLFENCTF